MLQIEVKRRTDAEIVELLVNLTAETTGKDHPLRHKAKFMMQVEDPEHRIDAETKPVPPATRSEVARRVAGLCTRAFDALMEERDRHG